jgi:hypothetical protein
VYQERLNDWYETYQAAHDPKDDCIDKLDRYNDRKICGKLPVNETVEIPVIFVCQLDCLELKTVKQALAYRTSCEIQTPYAGEDGILLT